MIERCEWKTVFSPDEYSDLNTIETSCENEIDDTSLLYEYNYCPYCGKKIKEIED